MLFSGIVFAIVWRTSNIWRGRFATTVAIGCEPGQVRKEAAAAADSGTAFQRIETASLVISALQFKHR